MLLVYFVLAIICHASVINSDLVGKSREINEKELHEITPLLNKSLNQLKSQSNGVELNLVRIITANVQVVAGKKYNIRAEFENPKNQTKTICKVSLWHQPWSGSRESRFECDDSTKFNTIQKVRSKRHTLVGGKSDIAPETLEQLRTNISESFVQLQSEGKKSLQLKQIISAKQQVVAGILYTVKTVVDIDGGEQNCEVTVWLKPWMDFRQISVSCDSGDKFQLVKDNRPKRSLMRPLIPLEKRNDENLDADSDENHFIQFKRNFGRSYENQEEDALRFRIFQNNLYLIRQLNKFEQGSAIYGVTDFADLTQAEYLQRTGLSRPVEEEFNNEIRNPLAEIPNIKLPKSFDWRDHKAITPVKNQGTCGSCWAFSVTGNIEGLYAIKSGQLKEFSEQELVDCDDLDAGCNGGLPDNAVKFIEKEGGLEFESDYPYTAHRSKSCQFNSSLSRVQVSGVIDFKKGDEDGMAKWLTVNGPISIGINANAMQFYRGGISHPWKALCRASSLDHGVLIVGYGIAEYPAFNKTLPYWIVKNSWGPRWGEQGYYRVYRGDNTCGVSSMASSAVLAKSAVN